MIISFIHLTTTEQIYTMSVMNVITPFSRVSSAIIPKPSAMSIFCIIQPCTFITTSWFCIESAKTMSPHLLEKTKITITVIAPFPPPISIYTVPLDTIRRAEFKGVYKGDNQRCLPHHHPHFCCFLFFGFRTGGQGSFQLLSLCVLSLFRQTARTNKFFPTTKTLNLPPSTKSIIC